MSWLDHELPRLIRSALESRQPVLIPHVSSQDLEALALTDDHLEALRAIELQSVMAIPLLAQGRLLGAITLLSSTRSRIYGQEDLRVAHELAQRAALAVDNARLYRAAQRAIQVRDEVLGIVAHDLRNPLSTILLEARLLRQRVTDVRARESGQAITEVATRMNRLIEDLLDVTRMEAGRLTVHQADCPSHTSPWPQSTFNSRWRPPRRSKSNSMCRRHFPISGRTGIASSRCSTISSATPSSSRHRADALRSERN